MNKVFLSLGSNLGDGSTQLQSACKAITGHARIIAQSKHLKTKPMYVVDQPDFTNQVILIETALSPTVLLQATKQIEKDLGRVSSFRYGPRTIDVDILYYEQEIIDLPDLIIPHPLIAEREFVLHPLAEIAPDWCCPKTKLTVKQMLLRFS